MAVPYIFLQDSLNVMLRGKMFNIKKDSPEFESVKDAIKANQSEDDIILLVDKGTSLVIGGKGKITVKDGEVFFKGRTCVGPIVDRILYMVEEGFDVSPIENFLDNLDLNPSSRSLEELYGFLEKCNLPITDDGCFLAYKKVKADWTDIHSGTILNTVGKRLSMPRNQVDDNFNNGCSKGFHVASRDYYRVSGYGNEQGNRLIVVKVNPKDVVSVPAECNLTKMRVCEYEVICEVEQDHEIHPNYVKGTGYSKDYSIPSRDETVKEIEENEGGGYDEEEESYGNDEEDDYGPVATEVIDYLETMNNGGVVSLEDSMKKIFGGFKKNEIIKNLSNKYNLDYFLLKENSKTVGDLIEAIESHK